MLDYLVPTMAQIADMNLAHAKEVEQLRLDDQCIEAPPKFETMWRDFMRRMRKDERAMMGAIEAMARRHPLSALMANS